MTSRHAHSLYTATSASIPTFTAKDRIAGVNVMRQFKARIDMPDDDYTVHAMEIWFQANNIVEAAEFVGSNFAAVGIFKEHVTKLIDITPEP